MLQRNLIVSLGLTLLLVLPALGREWTAKSGKSIEAELIKVENGVVHLRRADGKEGSIPYDQLSAADQAYLDALNQSAPSAPPPQAAPANAPAPDKPQAPGLDFANSPIAQALQRAPANVHWLIVIAILNIPLLFVWGKFFFGGWAEFMECVRYSLTPDIVSMFRGEWGDDIWAEWKLQIFWLWIIITLLIQAFLFLQFVVPLFE